MSVEFTVLNYDIGEGEFEEVFFLGGGGGGGGEGELGGEASPCPPSSIDVGEAYIFGGGGGGGD